jgi:hypothetical protein
MDLRNGKDGCQIPNQRFIPESGDAATQKARSKKLAFLRATAGLRLKSEELQRT